MPGVNWEAILLRKLLLELNKHSKVDESNPCHVKMVIRNWLSHFFYLEGVVEIWLTSEDTGAYGRDIGSSLPELLWQLIELIPEGAMLRLGMTNPPYILEHLEVWQRCLVIKFVKSSYHLSRGITYYRTWYI